MSTFFKSLGAIVAGFVTVFALSTLTDIVVEGVGIFPPSTEPDAYVWWMLLLALIYRIAFTILGGYITARLAPRKPLNHSIILGLIGTLGGITGVIAAWHLGNHWYPILLAATALPSTWFGGKLFVRRK